MSAHFTVSDIGTFHGPDLYVNCAGTVRAPHGAGIQRKIIVTPDNNPYEILTVAESSIPTGSFSFQILGHETAEFTVIVKGEYGENDSVYANVNLNGTGPTGLYIAPPLNNLPFIVGPGDVTSPFVDILIPMPVVEAEAQADIVAWGDVTISPTVEAVGATPIISWGSVNFGFSIVEGFGSVIYATDGDINFPDPRISGDAEVTIISWGNVSIPGPVVAAFTTDEGEVRFPSPVVSAVGVTTIICHGAVELGGAVITASGKAGPVLHGAIGFPVPVVAGNILVTELCHGAVIMPAPVVSAAAIQEETAYGAINFPIPVVKGFATSQHSFIPAAYTPDCGVA
jgi:hypothetical protein